MPEYTWVNDDIFTVSEFLTPAECAEYVALSEAIGYDAAPITTSFGPRIRPDVRNNTRVMVDRQDWAAALWERAAVYVPDPLGERRAVGVNERFRFYRYEPGQQFDWHYDGCFERPSGERSLLTFMIYLNDDFEGGRTEFSDAKVVPQTGLALFFRHAIIHRGAPVASGRKYVLRTDVMYSA